MKYAIMDVIRNGDIFSNEKLFDDPETAIKAARREWDSLSEYDKKRRAAFYVIAGDPDPETDCLNEGDVIWEV